MRAQMRILVVEDEALIAAEIAAILRRAGYIVVGTAGSAEQVIAFLMETPCDFAVVDANLAGSSTAPVAAALKRRSIPFVVVSGYSRRELLLPLQDAPFVPKPINDAALLAALASLQANAAE
jgi:CheY-like chemotaxis protein